MAGLKDGAAGRRSMPRDPEKELLQNEVKKLREQLGVQEQLQRIREVLQVDKTAENRGLVTKKKGGAGGHDPENHG